MPKKRSKTTGRFQPQYKKTATVVNQIAAYLHGLNWQKRLEFLLSPAGFIAQVDIDLWKAFKHLEDIDAF